MTPEEFKKLGQERPPSNTPPADSRLYDVYAQWSGQLHAWVKSQLGRHVDCQFFPAPDWKFKIYSGQAGVSISEAGIMNVVRPAGESSFTVALPRPEQNPSQATLDKTFRNLCLATAKLLEIELHAPKLRDSPKRPALNEPRGSKPVRRSLRPPKGRRRPADEDR